ncbi:hypothetical protein M4951_08320 [Blastopirellula sp. J2-11]|uniref:hypothetical protein n=1 Tax=Blastopirellula sp. J2-11 TaxID=2943192 RepID=UPI0021C87570|nr:hypothetical protein [Blastopirellula sp. J2-11]UUO08306.1 hypothetical protein M4951_08320 [Blastopirellula sp. J2-11]
MSQNIWCVNLKAQPTTAQFCIARGIVGIGWGIDPPPTSAPDYLRRSKVKYGNISWTTATNILLKRMNVDDLVWTRTSNATYYLGRVTSDWRSENDQDFRDADTRNVRDCDWITAGSIDEVPGRVLNNFRRGRTAQQVKSRNVNRYSRFFFNQKKGENIYPLDPDTTTDIFDLLDPDDFEDVVGIYLQLEKRLLIYPSTCKRDTKHIEFILVSREGTDHFGVQVKAEKTSLLNHDNYRNDSDKAFLFSASGEIQGSANDMTEIIPADVIRKFIFSHRDVMPRRIQAWIKYVKTCVRED